MTAATDDMNSIFLGSTKQRELIRDLPLCKKIADVPFYANIAMTMRHVATHYFYVQRALKPRGEILSEIARGIGKAIDDMHNGKGKALDATWRQYLKVLASKYIEALAVEVDGLLGGQSGDISAFASPTTELLMKELADLYKDDSYSTAEHGAAVASRLALVSSLNTSVASALQVLTSGAMRITLDDPRA